MRSMLEMCKTVVTYEVCVEIKVRQWQKVHTGTSLTLHLTEMLQACILFYF